MPPFPKIQLPLNSASLWASTFDDLTVLYNSPYTGAITTRTACSVDSGFKYDESIQHHVFFSTISQKSLPKLPTAHAATTHPSPQSGRDVQGVSTLNTLGYSPYSLRFYVESVKKIQDASKGPHKPVIFSVTGNSSTILACYSLIARNYGPVLTPWREWCMEINLSCPNIAGAPPPAFSRPELARLLTEVSDGIRSLILQARRQLETKGVDEEEIQRRLNCWNIPIGLKLPPYTYAGQFNDLVETVSRENGRFGFSDGTSDSLDTPSFAAADPLSGGDLTAKTYARFSKNTISPQADTVDPAFLATSNSIDLDATLAEDLAVSLSLDEAISLSPGKAQSSEVWRVLSRPFPVSFLTSTNSLGSCLHMSETQDAEVSDWASTLASPDTSGIGGLAGAALHQLSLGNVKTLKGKLRANEDSSEVAVIGVGGVADSAGFQRMKKVGADAVGLATALGAKGVSVFAEIVQHDGNMRVDDVGDE